MIETIIVAVITGGLSLTGVIITNMNSNKQIENKLLTTQAVTDTKIENLTLEVRKNNDLIVEIPVIKTEVNQLKRDIEDAKRQIEEIRKEIREIQKEVQAHE